jgi:putative two-component system response regulator
LALAEESLEDEYQVMTLPSAKRMFTLLEKITPHLILLDIEMPEMNGFEALSILKRDERFSDIPVIFLTSRTDAAGEEEGLILGAVDYITKPFTQPVLKRRIKVHLDVDELVREQTMRLRHLQSGIVFVLADIVENRDMITGGHIERTTGYLKILMEAMLKEGVYIDELKKWDLELTASAARLHDVGKITISDTILNKPARLTDEEYELIKSHVTEGERVINQMIDHTGEEAFLNHAKLFAGMHHEHWDGSGYPRKLSGTDIPLEGRIMAIADVYDALVSERPYKKPFTHEEAIAIIQADAEKHFDPAIVGVLMKVHEKFKSVDKKQRRLNQFTM